MSSAPSPAAPALVGSRGEAIPLGSHLGGGGEGEVYAVAGRAGVAVKLLHEPMSAEKAAKIEALARLRGDALDAAAAWPIELVHDGRGRPRGFLLPLVAGCRELHELYSPKSRIASFPSADAPFLLGVGLNLARAVAVVHRAGCVIGDVNHASVLVSARGLVRLIDCDSFQLRDGARLFTCDVGQALFTPPELQGENLRGRERTPDHDAFGLAVLLFQLLFMGRHPYAGRHLAAGDMPIERAIKEGRFAYGPNARTRRMAPPPHTLTIDVYGLPVADLFERAFTAEGRRPSAQEWVESLGGARAVLQRCAQNERHAHRAGLPACPFCRIEDETGAFLFGFAADQLARNRGLPAADRVAAAWAAVCRIALPGAPEPDFDAALAGLRPAPVAPGMASGEQLRGWSAGLMVAGGVTAVVSLLALANAESAGAGAATALAAGVGVLVLGAILGRVAAAREDAPLRTGAVDVALVQKELRELRLAWLRTRGWAHDLERARGQVAGLMREWEKLPLARRAMLQQLEARDHERQLTRFLNRFSLAGAGISGIGPTRTAALQSFGIWTAGDATEDSLRRVPGFGPQRIGAVLAWRQACAAGFQPGPPLPPDPSEIARIERSIAQEARRLADEIGKAPAALETARRRILAERRRIEERLGEIAAAASPAP
jgi:DNA-binding helix-hairpin-helix protein with protein kinase domain